MKKILFKIKHLFINDVDTWVETGEVKYEYLSPFDLFPTQFLQYKCRHGINTWMPLGDFLELRSDKILMDLRLKVANDWKEKGDLDMAIKVLEM